MANRAAHTWNGKAFKHQGRCDICSRWTRGGVRVMGRLRYKHLCLDCARDAFPGAISLFTNAHAEESQPTPPPKGETR